jgi:uncharacterized protein (DUF849 family)
MDACIIEVALNGTTTKAANPRVPRSPAEIAADVLACIEAGATIVHNHNDEPMWVGDGVHAVQSYLDAWRPILAAHPRVMLYATMASGGPGIAIETRWAHHRAAPVGRPHQALLRRPDAVRAASHRGGHVRVGLEDCAGERTPSNVELVQEAAALIGARGRAVADAEQTQALLS